MLKTILTTLAVTSAAHAWAQPGPSAEAPRPVSFAGRAIEAFEGRHAFTFTAPASSACEAKYDDPTLKLWDCTIPAQDAARARLGGEGQADLAFTFTSYRAQHKSWNRRMVNQFDFVGTYAQADGVIPEGSEVWMQAWWYEDEPNVVRVKWSLPEYGIARSFRATPTAR